MLEELGSIDPEINAFDIKLNNGSSVASPNKSREMDIRCFGRNFFV